MTDEPQPSVLVAHPVKRIVLQFALHGGEAVTNMVKDLAVVSCYFNSCNYRSRERNLSSYIDSMRQQ